MFCFPKHPTSGGNGPLNQTGMVSTKRESENGPHERVHARMGPVKG